MYSAPWTFIASRDAGGVGVSPGFREGADSCMPIIALQLSQKREQLTSTPLLWFFSSPLIPTAPVIINATTSLRDRIALTQKCQPLKETVVELKGPLRYLMDRRERFRVFNQMKKQEEVSTDQSEKYQPQALHR